MGNTKTLWLGLIATAITGSMLGGCTKINLGGSGPIPTVSPSASTSPTPGACSTQNPSTNVVIVAMGSGITATTSPSYGPVGGYSPVNLSTHTVPNVAAVINQYVNSSGKTVPITSQNVLQFANVDSAYSGVNHSAVGFKGEEFPAQPYMFPSAAPSPTANAISAATFWSTGRVAPPANASTSNCFSQTFTLKTGVYYFGDLDFYNITTTYFRDVLVVGTPAPLTKIFHSNRTAARVVRGRLSFH